MHRSSGIEFVRRRSALKDGSPLPIVLLHGIGSNANSWRSTIEALPREADVIAWHTPGYESSDSISQPFPSASDYADALERLLDTFQFGRFVLVGHSLGALFAGRYAATRPHRVAALGLLSPALGYGVPLGEPLPGVVQRRLDELNALGANEFAERRAARLVFDSKTKPDVLKAVKEAMSRIRVAGYTQAVGALGAGDLIADASLIRSPTLVAVGTEDVVTPPANAAKLFAALKYPLALIQVPKVGHALPQEAPNEVAQIMTWLIEAARDG
jgi:pimeloyl-ACP methyl ester carboxylesterase